MPRLKRSISEPEKKIVAVGQRWNCSDCRVLLDGTYQVDHTVALADGGADDVSNMTAMCVACHSRKTQRENGERARIARMAFQAALEHRVVVKHGRNDMDEDVVVDDGKRIMCTTCRQIRDASIAWDKHVCMGTNSDIVRVRAHLQQYAR